MLWSYQENKKPQFPQVWPFIGGTIKVESWLMMHVVLSHHICHLLVVQDDAFDITYQATPVSRSEDRHVLTDMIPQETFLQYLIFVIDTFRERE